MEQESTFPAKCCGQEFVLHDIEKLLQPPHRRLQYATAAAQFSVPGHERVFCAKGCGAYLGPSTQAETLNCHKCKHVTCTKCKETKHAGDCMTSESAFDGLVQARGWQVCTNCKSVVELNEGCNHMTYVSLPPYQIITDTMQLSLRSSILLHLWRTVENLQLPAVDASQPPAHSQRTKWRRTSSCAGGPL